MLVHACKQVRRSGRVVVLANVRPSLLHEALSKATGVKILHLLMQVSLSSGCAHFRSPESHRCGRQEQPTMLLVPQTPHFHLPTGTSYNLVQAFARNVPSWRRPSSWGPEGPCYPRHQRAWAGSPEGPVKQMLLPPECPSRTG